MYGSTFLEPALSANSRTIGQIKDKEGDSDPLSDIIAVDYSNDGKFLNATLWLSYPPKDKPYSDVNYSMIIDSDNDNATGRFGIDYELEISFNNETQTWTRTLYTYPPTGDRIPLVQQTITPFFFGGIPLSLDLNKIRHGDFYKVAFYSESQFYGSSKDETTTVHFPPLSISITAAQPTLTIRPGESQTIDLRVNSTGGYEPLVTFYTDPNTAMRRGIETHFPFNNVSIPSSGTVTTPVNIAVHSYAIDGVYTLVIFANSTLEPGTYHQNVTSQYPLTIRVPPPLSISERLNLFSPEAIKIPQEYLVGFYIIVLSLAIPAVARWFASRKQISHLNRFMTAIISVYDLLHEKKDLCERCLENIRRQVDQAYAKGKISESNYKILNEKISDYEKKLNEVK